MKLILPHLTHNERESVGGERKGNIHTYRDQKDKSIEQIKEEKTTKKDIIWTKSSHNKVVSTSFKSE